MDAKVRGKLLLCNNCRANKSFDFSKIETCIDQTKNKQTKMEQNITQNEM